MPNDQTPSIDIAFKKDRKGVTWYGMVWYGMVWYGRSLWRIAGGRSVQVQLRIGTISIGTAGRHMCPTSRETLSTHRANEWENRNSETFCGPASNLISYCG